MAIAVAALLAAIAIPAYQGQVFRARVAEATSDIKKIEREIERFRTRFGSQLPGALTDLDLESFQDPWGNPYQYLSFTGLPGTGAMRKDHNLVPINTDYDLYSMGPDGESKPPLTAKASQDDIVRASNGRFVGLAREY